ncbi:MAG: hypothetical protein RLZZ458_1685 [Planctomycetota bacterium]
MRSASHLPALFLLAAMCILQCGCGQSDHPGNWSQEKVAAKLTEKMQLKSISLTPVTGGYSGTASSPDGETWKLQVTQDPAKRRLDYTAEGDRGSSEEGFVEG